MTCLRISAVEIVLFPSMTTPAKGSFTLAISGSGSVNRPRWGAASGMGLGPASSSSIAEMGVIVSRIFRFSRVEPARRNPASGSSARSVRSPQRSFTMSAAKDRTIARIVAVPRTPLPRRMGRTPIMVSKSTGEFELGETGREMSLTRPEGGMRGVEISEPPRTGKMTLQPQETAKLTQFADVESRTQALAVFHTRSASRDARSTCRGALLDSRRRFQRELCLPFSSMRRVRRASHRSCRSPRCRAPGRSSRIASAGPLYGFSS